MSPLLQDHGIATAGHPGDRVIADMRGLPRFYTSERISSWSSLDLFLDSLSHCAWCLKAALAVLTPDAGVNLLGISAVSLLRSPDSICSCNLNHISNSISIIMDTELIIILMLLKERISLVDAALLMRIIPIIKITVFSDLSLSAEFLRIDFLVTQQGLC